MFVAGIDEAGRGPLAGPVTAACVVLPPRYRNDLIADSKALSEEQREELFSEITGVAIAYAVVSVGHHRISTLNIRRATQLAMSCAAARVFRKLQSQLGNGGYHSQAGAHSLHLLIDGNMPIETPHPFDTIIKGDARVQLIAAASILAKVTRDRLMKTLDLRYPGYGLSTHKGYATEFHRQQIAALGPALVHRATFAGVREFLRPRELV